MEAAEISLEHLRQEIHHHAKHGGGPWISWVALSTVSLAVLGAITGLLSGVHVNEVFARSVTIAP